MASSQQQQEAAVTLTFDTLSEVLRPLLQQAVQQAAGQQSPAPTDEQTEQLLAGLNRHLASYVQGSTCIQAKGVPLPEVDEQLLPLQQQVEAVMQSVAVHRASVPAVISKALEQQLQAMRPPGFEGVAGADDVAQAAADQQAAAPAAAVESAAAAASEVAQAQQLQEALRTALRKLPALRARLEEMDVRLQRNLEAVDAAHASAEQAPRTVERVLRSVAAAGGGGGGAGKGRSRAAAGTGAGGADEEGDASDADE